LHFWSGLILIRLFLAFGLLFLMPRTLLASVGIPINQFMLTATSPLKMCVGKKDLHPEKK